MIWNCGSARPMIESVSPSRLDGIGKAIGQRKTARGGLVLNDHRRLAGHEGVHVPRDEPGGKIIDAPRREGHDDVDRLAAKESLGLIGLGAGRGACEKRAQACKHRGRSQACAVHRPSPGHCHEGSFGMVSSSTP